MTESRHIADGESEFRVTNVTPDFCEVDGYVLPFEIYQLLSSERIRYAKTVNARGCAVLTVGSVVAGVVGNMGRGVISTVSQSEGDTIIIQGSPTVRAEGRPVCRHHDICIMNVRSQ